MGVRERKLRDKNKGTRRGVGVYWMGYTRGIRAYKDRKGERDTGMRERMERIPREMGGKGNNWQRTNCCNEVKSSRERERKRKRERGSEL